MNADREFPFTRKDFAYLSKVINERTGIVVSDDKFNMFYSRLSRRLRALQLTSFKDYCELVKHDRDGTETIELTNAITTNLTAFFRENHHFEYLANTVIPEMMSKNSNRKFSIWSAGCSTGEEPYSLAITLKESALARGGQWQIDFTATDLDSNVVATAQRGVYPMARVEGISKPRLKTFFLRGKGGQDGMVKAKPELTRMIEFGQLNLMDNWSVEPKDVIFCRNVIIYFNKETKTRLVEKYADSLKPGGYLFIGHSESLYKISDRFELIGNTVYRKVR